MDVFRDGMLNVADAALYLDMPESTLTSWRRDQVIHSVAPQRKGWPTLPFVGVVEAFVLRQLRELGYSRGQITQAAEGVRRQFGDEYALARPGIGHDDGVEIFFQVGGDLFRAKDGQQALRETVESFRECIAWRGEDPQSLRLAQLGNVYLDPRFGWGKPVAPNRIPVPSIMGLWYAGDDIDTIAAEYEMDPRDVQSIIQGWSRIHDRRAA